MCPLVPEHIVSVVHSDALAHPAKPQTKAAGKEGNQGGLPEKHTVRHRQHKMPTHFVYQFGFVNY